MKFWVNERDVVQGNWPSLRDEEGTLVAVFMGYGPKDIVGHATAVGRAYICAKALSENETPAESAKG